MLITSDGEYRCRAAVFAVGVTEPWKAPIPGIEEAPHYTETGEPSRYQGQRVFIIGKRNSGFEVATGLLPWASQLVLASPRPVDTAVLGRLPVRVRYLEPLDEYCAGRRWSVRRRRRDRTRRANGGRLPDRHRAGRPGLETSSSRPTHVLVATGFTDAAARPARRIGLATVADGRIPALTPFWESVSMPGVYFAGNASQGSPGLRKQGLASNSTSVNGFRYNARTPRATPRGDAASAITVERRRLEPAEVVPYLLSRARARSRALGAEGLPRAGR